MVIFIIFLISNLVEVSFQLQNDIECDFLSPPKNGHFIGGYCSNQINSACVINCELGYTTHGSTFRQCIIENGKPTWTGKTTSCQIKKCPDIFEKIDENLKIECSQRSLDFKTMCNFTCDGGYQNIGSSRRVCLALGSWSGLDAKCRKIENYVASTILPSPTTTTKMNFNFADLSNESISFGYNFKKVKLMTFVVSLPATFRFWARSNYTQNIKIFSYAHDCVQISVYSDQNSSLILNLNKKYNYKLHKTLTRNHWTQFAVVQNSTEWNFFIDGALHLDIDKLKIEQNCDKFSYDQIHNNQFLIMDDFESHQLDSYQPMRGEITQVYLFNSYHTEDEIVRSYYLCEKSVEDLNNLVFDWSHVLITDYLRAFNRKKTQFCNGCHYPEVPKYSAINFEGMKIGSIRLYKCMRGFDMIGYASSVCMVYGDWSHKSPRCKVNRVEYRKYEKEKAVIWENKVRKPKNRLKIKNEKFYIIVD